MTLESILQHIIAIMQAPIIHIGQTPVTLGGVFGCIGIVVVACSLSGLAQRAMTHRLVDKLGLQPGIAYALRRFVHYGILCIGFVIAAQCVGLNLSSLTVVLGFLSVGIGFGLQNITANFISGLILLIERPINIGDMVSVEEHGNTVLGRVKQVNMRSTEIRTVDNVSIIMPNSHFIENPVTNWSIGDLRVRIHMNVGVAYGSDVARVTDVLTRVAAEHPDVLEEPQPEVRFLAFGDSSLDFALLAWIGRPGKQWQVQSDLYYAIDAGFRQAGVTIPFPQRDLHVQTSPATEQLLRAVEKSS
jgi:potassium-dependent mechanosensitive channel